MGFRRAGWRSEAKQNRLKKSQLRRPWTPRTRDTELGQDPIERRIYRRPACVPDSQKHEKLLEPTGEERADVEKVYFIHEPILIRAIEMVLAGYQI